MTSGAQSGEQAGGSHGIAVIEVAECTQSGGHKVGLTGGRICAGGVEIRCGRLHLDGSVITTVRDAGGLFTGGKNLETEI